MRLNDTLTRPTGDAADRNERARAAVKAFRSMQHSLTGYARAITGNPKVRIEVSAGPPRTDGNIIYYQPPIRLGDKTRHDRERCDKRDPQTGLQTCPACSIREEVLVNVYHEIAHIVFGTFAPTRDADKRGALVRAVGEWGTKYADKIEKVIDAAPPQMKSSYLGLATLISPFLPSLLNCLEDARVDKAMFDARKGTKKMLMADTYSLFRDGSEDMNGKHREWNEADLNSQAAVACYLFAAGYEDWQGYLHPQIGADFADPELQRLLGIASRAESAIHTYEASFPILDRLRDLGYMRLPEEQDEQPEEQPEPDQDEPEESDDQGDAGDAGEPDESGQQPDASPEEEGGEETSSGGDESGEDGDGSDEAGEPSDDAGSGDDPEDSGEGESESGEADSGDGQDDDSDDGGTDSDGSGESGSPSEDEGDGGGDESGESDSGGGSEESPEDVGHGDESDSTDNEAGPGSSGAGEGEAGEADSGGDGEHQDLSSGSASEGDGGDSEEPEGEDEADGSSGGQSDDAGEPSDSEGREGGDGTPSADGEEQSPSGDPAEADSVGDEGVHEEDAGTPQEGAGTDGEQEGRDDRGAGDLDEAPGDTPTSGEGDSGSEAPQEEPGDAPLLDPRDDNGQAIEVPEWGDPEDVEHTVGKLHQEGHEDQVEAFADADTMTGDQKAIAIAVTQGHYFETPSAHVSEVTEWRTEGPAWELLSLVSNEQAWAAGIVANCDVPENILGPSLLKLRRIFDDNKVSSNERHRRSGKVDAKVLGRRAWSGDDRLFSKKRIPGKKDYSVLICMDISSSNLNGNLALVKRAVFAQAELMARLGVEFSIIAHHCGMEGRLTERSFNMHLYHIKDWTQPWDEENKNRLRNIGAVGGNLDGHALEFCRKQLDRVDTTDRIVLYYTDGKMPAANKEEELLILQREIRTCKQKGYTLLGVGIGTDSPSQHGLDTVQVDDDEDLSKVVEHLGRRLANPAR